MSRRIVLNIPGHGVFIADGPEINPQFVEFTSAAVVVLLS